MRKLTVLFATLMVLCSLSACSVETYEDGYRDGYSDAEFEMGYLAEEEFQAGYDIGYDVGYYEAEKEYSYYGWLEDEAIHYARKYSEWSPEEAMWVIESYQSKKPIDGTLPSYEEYLDAIESLYRFYEYFYYAMYE